MPKRRLKVRFRLPKYISPRNAWRRQIYDAARTAMDTAQVSYRRDDALTVLIVLYLSHSGMAFHDVDNRLKDVLDALQGRMGGPKAHRRHAQLIYNDSQICRAVITKLRPPPQSHGLGSVTIKAYSPKRS
jgi:hypothetical protein